MTQVLKLTKLDAAERQLKQAIRLFFAEEDSVSIHTLAEASSQVLADIGKLAGVRSFVRDNYRIRPEAKKEWLQAVFKSRNFFKHADKDAGVVHEFNPESNVFTLVDSLSMLSQLKDAWSHEALQFWIWFELAYPHLLEEGIEPFSASLGVDLPAPSNKGFFLSAINRSYELGTLQANA